MTVEAAASRVNRAGRICTVTRIGRLWDAILVTDAGLRPSCEKCAQSHRFGLRSGRVGGIPLGGGWGGGVGEPTTGIIYIYIYLFIYLFIFIFIFIYLLIYVNRQIDG